MTQEEKKLRDEIWKQIQLNFCASKLEAKRVVLFRKEDLHKAFGLAIKEINGSDDRLDDQ